MIQITYKKTEDLIPYENNPRTIPEEAINAVAESIQEFGFKNPILIDKNNVIVAGHTRRLASLKLGLDMVPCVIVDDLTPQQVKALRLADNKTNELAEWDISELNFELSDLLDFDMERFGFGEEEEEGKKGEEKVEAEVQFSEVLNEEHNYIVLYFDNDIDWLQAETLLQLPKVKALLTNKDGKESKTFKRTGVARVMKGSEAIRRIQEA